MNINILQPLPPLSVHIQVPTRNQQQQQQQRTVQLSRTSATLSRIPSLCPDMLFFFKMANLGDRDTDPVPLCCQENGLHNIVFFGFLLDDDCNKVLQTYNTNGDGSGTCRKITTGVMTQLRPAIKYCRYFFANMTDPDAIRPQSWDKPEYKEFYCAFCLGKITDSTILNCIGKVTQTQLSNVLATLSLTPSQLLHSFMRATKSIDKLMILKEDAHNPLIVPAENPKKLLASLSLLRFVSTDSTLLYVNNITKKYKNTLFLK